MYNLKHEMYNRVCVCVCVCAHAGACFPDDEKLLFRLFFSFFSGHFAPVLSYYPTVVGSHYASTMILVWVFFDKQLSRIRLIVVYSYF